MLLSRLADLGKLMESGCFLERDSPHADLAQFFADFICRPQRSSSLRHSEREDGCFWKAGSFGQPFHIFYPCPAMMINVGCLLFVQVKGLNRAINRGISAVNEGEDDMEIVVTHRLVLLILTHQIPLPQELGEAILHDCLLVFLALGKLPLDIPTEELIQGFLGIVCNQHPCISEMQQPFATANQFLKSGDLNLRICRGNNLCYRQGTMRGFYALQFFQGSLKGGPWQLGIQLWEKMSQTPGASGPDDTKAKIIQLRAAHDHTHIHKFANLPIREKTKGSKITDEVFHNGFQNVMASVSNFHRIDSKAARENSVLVSSHSSGSSFQTTCKCDKASRNSRFRKFWKA